MTIPWSAVPNGLGRRGLLRGGAAALATLALPHVARSAGTAHVLKLGHIGMPDSQVDTGSREMARRVEATTGGAYRVELYPGGALGGEVELMDGLRKGEVDLAFVTAVVFAAIVPEFGVFDLPFLFRDADHAHAVLDGPIGREYLEKFRKREFVALAWGENGMRHLTNSKHPVHEPGDLRGLRLRVPQSPITLRCFRQLGVDAAPLGFPALYGALESGRFDGEENPISTIRASHFDQVQRYLTLSGHQYNSAIIFISKDCWDDLNPAEQEAFSAAARAGGVVSRETAGRADRDGVEALRVAGMEITRSVNRDAFLAALEPTWSQLAQQFGEDNIARMRAVGS